MASALHIVQIIIAAFLIVIILMQVRGEGGSTPFGAAESTGRIRRGLEKVLFNATVGLTALFLIVALASARLT